MSHLDCRVPPINDLDSLSERQKQLQERLGRRGKNPKNIYRTLLRFPDFLAAMLPLGGRAADSSLLTPRLREFVILRTAWRCDCEYEWAQHTEIARKAGLTDEEIERIGADPAAASLGEEERMVMRAVDDLFENANLTTSSWDWLKARYDEDTIVDIIATCGFYTMLAWQLRSLGVQIEEGRAGYPVHLKALKATEQQAANP